MQVDGKTVTIGSDVWVQHGGVDVIPRGDRTVFTAQNEEAYVKVLNHFGRVLKLYTFEDGRWVDADTGVTAQPFDESQAGRLPAAPAPSRPAGKTTGKAPARKTAAKYGTGTAAKSRTAKGVGKAAAKSGTKAAAKNTRRASAKRTPGGKSTRRRAG